MRGESSGSPAPQSGVLPPRTKLAAALEQVHRRPELIGAVFQPIVDLERGVPCGYEILARFPHPPLVRPEHWFGAASARGVTGPLEARMVRYALSRRADLPAGCFMSINLSPRGALARPVQAAFATAEDLDDVVVEITERIAVSDYDQLTDALAPLRARGARVAVDDAGSGFASLRQILELRPEHVKVDRSLVGGVDREPLKAAAVETLGDYARRIGAALVAEGVERVEELDTLIGLGVPLAQGFLLARPGAELAGLDADLAAHAREQAARRRDARSVGALVEPVAALPAQASPEQVAARFAGDPALEYVAMADEAGRPVAIITREASAAGRTPTEPLRIETRDAVRPAARRAMSRPSPERFDPLTCCDDQGRLVGVVRVERLVEFLSR